MKNCNPKYAAKGLPKVPGKPKGTDIIPAWLTPGEAVLSPGAAEMLGRGNVQALNRAANHMRLGNQPQYKAQGGLIDPSEWDGQQGELIDTPDDWKVKGANSPSQPSMQLTDPSQFTGQNGQWIDTPNGQMIASRTDDKPFNMEMRDTENGMQPQYFMGGTGMVKPMYLAGGINELEKRNPPYADLPTITQAQPQNLPAGYQAGQQLRQTLAGQSDRLGKFTAPIETGLASMGEVMRQAGKAIDSPTSPIRMAGALMGASNKIIGDTGSNFAQGALGMQPPKPNQAGGILNTARADAGGTTGNAMNSGLMQPNSFGIATGMNPQKPNYKPMSGGAYYLDQASADAATKARALDPGYEKTATGTMVNRQTTPDELAKQMAGWANLDKMNARQPIQPQSTLGTSGVTRPQQPLQTMTQPMQQLGRQQSGDDGYRAALANSLRPENRMMQFEQDKMRMLGELKNSALGFNQLEPEQRDYASRMFSALSGTGASNPNAVAGLRGADVASTGNNLDYNAKMSEIGAGQGLRDAQSQQAMSYANNLMSDAALQDAMRQNPQQFAGMRLGGRGMGGRGTASASSGDYKLQKGIIGYDDKGFPIESDLVFNPTDGSSRPLLTPEEQVRFNQRKQMQPGADESSILSWILSKRKQQLAAE